MICLSLLASQTTDISMAGTDSVFASKESGVTAAAQDVDVDNAAEILRVNINISRIVFT